MPPGREGIRRKVAWPPAQGVYVCHCGTNIAGKIDVEELARYARGLPGVAVSRDYRFMCSEPGQEQIRKDIQDYGLNRVVVAACSPRMHEGTFRKTCQAAGINPYFLQIANIREHCSWVTDEPGAALDKAKDIVRAAVARVALHEPLPTQEVPVLPDVLVVGGGIAGIQAALDIADAGYRVHLVERLQSIGGHMAQLDKTFPTLDCSACILTPKMVSVGTHPMIRLHAYSEIQEISGYVGNFKVKILHKATYVDHRLCTGCGGVPGEVPQASAFGVQPGAGSAQGHLHHVPQAVPTSPS
jgi:heterodisulfide reductase subunit A